MDATDGTGGFSFLGPATMMGAWRRKIKQL